MSVPAFASPPPDAPPVAIAVEGEVQMPVAGSDDTDLLTRLASKHGLPETPAVIENTPPAEGDNPPPAVEPVKPAEPVTPPGPTGAARRVADKTNELETLKARIAELEATAAKVPDLETRFNETKTLKEQQDIELEKHRTRFQNEAKTLDPSLVFEVPAVLEAQNRYNEVATNLFPVDISNPADGEPDLRFDPNHLDSQASATIHSMLNRWEAEEFNSKSSPQRRAQIQHIVLSNIAAAIGVDKEKFQEVQIDGSPYNVIPANHPVYLHLKQSIRPFINARRDFTGAQERAKTDMVETGKSIVGTRVNNTKKMFSDVGVGLTGDALREKLTAQPDNAFLKTMALIEGDETLVKTLKENIEFEAATNGYFRPQLDLFDSELDSRETAAKTHMQRIGNRVLHGAIGPVLMTLAHKQAEALKAKDAEIAQLRAEANRTLMQAEPGAVTNIGEAPRDANGPAFTAAEEALRAKYNL